MESLNDFSLVAQVAVFHNRRAFDQLVRKYQSPVRRFLLNLTLGNEALSDDLAQETFLKAYTHITQFKNISSFKTWLFRIAYNVFYDYKRKEGGKWMEESGESVDHKAELTSSHQSLSTSHLKMDIQAALGILKEEERACVTLQLIEGYSLGDIARMTGMPENTVKSHLRRGKEKLTTYLKKNGYGGN